MEAQRFAQRDLGTITGTVTDPAGASVSNAAITVSGQDTGINYKVRSDVDGSYVRGMLPTGIYSVTAEAKGFKKKIQRNVKVDMGARVGVDLALEIGSLTESVVVTDAPPPIQTESTVTGATFESKTIIDLPIGGSIVSLAMLSAGVLPGEPGSSAGFSANGVVSNGQNNFLLNGVDNNSNMMDFGNGSQYALSPNLEAIGEARVMTNGFNAEYGRGAGGVMDVSIKSGTNALHGSVFGSFTNQSLDANNFFSNSLGVARPDSSHSAYGFTAGGPAIKNKTFWFVDYSGSRGNGKGLNYYTIPYPEFRTGDYSRLQTGSVAGADWLGNAIPGGAIYDFRSTQWTDLGGGNYAPIRTPFPGNVIPAADIDPVALKVAALLPAPNNNLGFAIPSNNYFGLGSSDSIGNQGDIRIDHHLSDSNMLFGSFSINRGSGTSVSALPDTICHCNPSWETGAMNVMASWTHLFSPTMISETRAAFTRLTSHSYQAADNADLYKQFGIAGYDPFSPSHGGLPELQIDGYSYLGSPSMSPSIEYSNVWDFIQNLAIQHGSNSLKLGVEARVINFPFEYSWEPQGMFNFPRAQTSNFADLADTGDGFASFLQGIPYAGRISTSNMISDRRLGYSGYVQDDWKVTSRLTLNLGLRYDLFSPIEETNGEQANFDPNTLSYQIPAGNAANNQLPDSFPSFVKVERGSVSRFLIPWKKTNFAPRIGLAYQPMKATVIRLAFGLFYGGEENESGLPNRGNNVPFNADAVLLPSDPTVTPAGLTTLAAGFPSNVMTQSMVLLRSIQNDALPALSQKWSATVQRELGWNTSLEASYLEPSMARICSRCGTSTSRLTPPIPLRRRRRAA